MERMTDMLFNREDQKRQKEETRDRLFAAFPRTFRES